LRDFSSARLRNRYTQHACVHVCCTRGVSANEQRHPAFQATKVRRRQWVLNAWIDRFFGANSFGHSRPLETSIGFNRTALRVDIRSGYVPATCLLRSVGDKVRHAKRPLAAIPASVGTCSILDVRAASVVPQKRSFEWAPGNGVSEWMPLGRVMTAQMVGEHRACVSSIISQIVWR
jgi:hypothetical protein